MADVNVQSYVPGMWRISVESRSACRVSVSGSGVAEGEITHSFEKVVDADEDGDPVQHEGPVEGMVTVKLQNYVWD